MKQRTYEPAGAFISNHRAVVWCGGFLHMQVRPLLSPHRTGTTTLSCSAAEPTFEILYKSARDAR